MTVLRRCGLAFLTVIVLFYGVAPLVSGTIDDLRIAHSAPLQTQEVRQKLAALPPAAQKNPAVLRLQVALAQDEQGNQADLHWSRGVASLLTEDQRKQGLLSADLSSPSPPPPMEASGVDGDVSHLAALLLKHYGYAGVEAPEISGPDPWVGVDRRSRTRALQALATQEALQPAQAQIILTLTLELLQRQMQRSENLAVIKTLLPVTMGDP